ncbi:hypothetical protein HY989_05810 [Candidatus Micrarchaeota archaeon]|nr:hypothetical protein [Candidatus Micrarchaeota archaeon]
MPKINIIGVPLDEEVVFIISLLIFLILTGMYFNFLSEDSGSAYTLSYSLQYTSGIGAFLSALSIYVFYKLHIIEEKLGLIPTPSGASSKRRR